MKNIKSILFLSFLFIWFVSGLYLSINFLVGYFVDLNPNIAKTLLASSFIGMGSIVVYNKIVGASLNSTLDSTIKDVKEFREKQEKKVKGCKSCKSKN